MIEPSSAAPQPWDDFNFEHWKDSRGVVHVALVNHRDHWLIRGAGPTHEAAVISLGEHFQRMRVIRAHQKAEEVGNVHPAG